MSTKINISKLRHPKSKMFKEDTKRVKSLKRDIVRLDKQQRKRPTVKKEDKIKTLVKEFNLQNRSLKDKIAGKDFFDRSYDRNLMKSKARINLANSIDNGVKECKKRYSKQSQNYQDCTTGVKKAFFKKKQSLDKRKK
jgi:hypothetical protein